MQKEINWLLKEKYGNKPSKAFEKDIKRLNGGEPLDYVIGFTNFLGCKIDLSKKSLIPRPETEFWVQKAIEDIKNKINSELFILDIFAGSGCIGIAVLRACPEFLRRVDFVDIEKKNLEQIKINLKINGVGVNFIVRQSDVFKNVRAKYDYIFANPPYIPDYRKNPSARLRAILRNRIQKSVLDFEPHKALFGGKDGLFYVRKFLKDAKKYLRKPAFAKVSAGRSKIYMEFDSVQKKEIEKLIKKNGYQNYEFYKDQYGKWRWVEIS